MKTNNLQEIPTLKEDQKNYQQISEYLESTKEYLYQEFKKLYQELNHDWSNFWILLDDVMENMILSFDEDIVLDPVTIDFLKEEIGKAFFEYFRNTTYKKTQIIPENLKNIILTNETTTEIRINYIRNSLDKILWFKKTNPDELISFLLFLLWVPEKYDLVGDLNLNQSWQLQNILFETSKNISELVYQNKDWNSEKLDKSIQRISFLYETLNKIILTKSIDKENRSLLSEVIMILSLNIKSIILNLENANYNKEKVNELWLMLWKLKLNFSHIIHDNIRTSFDEVREWIRIFEKSDYWNDRSRRKKFRTVWAWNLALARIKNVKKLESDIWSEDIEKRKKRLIWRIIKVCNIDSDRKIESSEEIINNFINSTEINEFQIEWISYLVEFDNINFELLVKLINFLIKENKVYENSYYENFKINTIIFAVNKICEKLTLKNIRETRLSSGHKDLISNITKYIEINRNTSHLFFNYSKIYISIALLYSNYEDHEKESMIFFNEFLTLNWENTSFYKKETEKFYQNLWPQWKTRFQDNKESINLRNENAVMVIIQDLIESTVNNIDDRSFQEINKEFCDTICKLIFNDLWSAEISKECEKCVNNKKCPECSKLFERWWYKKKKIDLKWWYKLIFKYPTTLNPLTRKNIFEEIFEKEEKFIKKRLWSLINIFLQKEELLQANEKFNKRNSALSQMATELITIYDPYTWRHVDGVKRKSRDYARANWFTDIELETLNIQSICHDLWKTKVAPKITKKLTRYTPEERKEMNMHTFFGLVECIEKWYPEEIINSQFHHCEFYNPKKWFDPNLTVEIVVKKVKQAMLDKKEKNIEFPTDVIEMVNQLCWYNIPIASRIISPADTSDAITSRRIYEIDRVWKTIEYINKLSRSEQLFFSWLIETWESIRLDPLKWKLANDEEKKLPYCILFEWKKYIPEERAPDQKWEIDYNRIQFDSIVVYNYLTNKALYNETMSLDKEIDKITAPQRLVEIIETKKDLAEKILNLRIRLLKGHDIIQKLSEEWIMLEKYSDEDCEIKEKELKELLKVMQNLEINAKELEWIESIYSTQQ
ncbi:MAG: hypothetical protein ACD_4C00091G0004 [uncultured bacterium (gcode 4)]|uniref:HD-GYP domain-containing protein n=1 Tax=uncultured bacterium (gcode 4) TaxID=1234023 RepID=K2GUH8_9BACT|nr:MAG: hypothetical protein ACD_4C00091G0004 [uncultured bacterium (gcode 4)]